jgi:dTDP-glucose 4,6-dehydratase
VITGGAGFLGSHLCERLMLHGYEVLCVDNLLTGTAANLLPLRETGPLQVYCEDACKCRLVPGRTAGRRANTEQTALGAPAGP